MRLFSHVWLAPRAAVCMALLGLGLLSAPVGCATQINSPMQPVLFVSDPPGAEVWVDDRFSVVTPGKVRLSRLSSHRARIEKVGYQPTVVEVDRGMSLWTLMDVVCLPLVIKCILDDRREGGFYSLDDEVHVTLTSLPELSPDTPLKPGPEAPPPAPTEALPEPGPPSPGP